MGTTDKPRKPSFSKLVTLTKQLSPELILQAAGRCDGHSILKPKAFLDAGLPAEVVAHLTSTFKSDGTPKGTIFVKGQAVEKLEGVYGLDVLKFIACVFDVKYQSCMGRGFQAQAIQRASIAHFKPAEK